MTEEKVTAEAIGKKTKKTATDTDAQAEARETATSMAATARKVLLASVGAVALTIDEIEDFVAKLVERGELAEQDGRKLVKDVMARRSDGAEEIEEKAEGQRHKIESMLDERIENILARLNVPSKRRHRHT